MARRILGGLLLAAGMVWSIGFPKNPSFQFGFVFSVALSIALLRSGILVLLANRFGRTTTVLSILLLVSIAANAALAAENRALGDLLLNLARRTAAR